MPRKGENIYKRKDGRWEGRYIKSRSLEGKAIYGYIYAKTYREVRSKLHEKSCATPIAPDPIMSPDLFGTLAQEWLSNARLQTKESTANKYQNLLDSYILPFCKNQPLSEFSYVYIEDYCQKLLSSGGKRENGLSPKTVSDAVNHPIIIFHCHLCVFQVVFGLHKVFQLLKPDRIYIVKGYLTGYL